MTSAVALPGIATVQYLASYLVLLLRSLYTCHGTQVICLWLREIS